MKKLFTILIIGFAVSVFAQQTTKSIPIEWTGSVGTDILGRELPTWAEAGPERNEKWFGILFSPFPAWSNRIGEHYDVYKYLQSHPYERRFEHDPAGEVVFPNWTWAEPWCGYYHGADPWVIRKQLIDMGTIGIDYVYWDFTNAASGWNNYSLDNSENWDVLKQYLEIGMELQKEGVNVPRISLYLGTELEKATEFCYKKIYKDHKYDDMIFYYRGKPLIHVLSAVNWTMPSNTPGFKNGVTHDIDPAKYSSPPVAQQIKDFFTFRQTWDWRTTLQDSIDYSHAWNSYGNFPAYDAEGKLECVGTSKAIGAPSGDGSMHQKGVSCVEGYNTDISNYNSLWHTPVVDKGLRNERDWIKAHKIDPPIVLSQRYNEWYAAVWADKNMNWLGTNNNTANGEGNFTDLFNPEFTSDLEPMKDLYKDNYFWQNAGHLRLHKGVARPELPTGPTNVAIDGSFGEWSAVKPVFIDASNDISVRDFRGNPNFIEGTRTPLWYKNTTARNDIIESRVAYNSTDVFMYVKTKAALSPSTGQQWMVLFINSDRRRNSGWEGYDLRVNYQRTGSDCTIDKYENGKWINFANGTFRTANNELELSIPRSALGLNQTKLAFDFKWSDNCLSANPTAMDFWENGDAAPQTRLNYRFSETQDPVAFGGVAQNLPGIVEAENFNNGVEGTAFHDNTSTHLGWAHNYRYPNDAVDMDYIGNEGISVGNTSSGEWLAYNVYAALDMDYTPVVYASSEGNNGAFHIEIDGKDKTGQLQIPSTNGEFKEFVFTAKKIHLTQDTYTIKIVFDGSFNLDAWGLTKTCDIAQVASKVLQIPGVIEAEDFDNGCEGEAYYDSDATNHGGQYRTNTGVDIEVCNEGGFDIGWVETGEWLEYTVNVLATDNYKMAVRYASSNSDGIIHVEVDGKDKTGLLTVPSTGGLQTWGDVNKTFSIGAGEHVIRLFFDKAMGSLNINNITFTAAGGEVTGVGTGLLGNYFQDNYAFNLTDWNQSATEVGAWNPPTNISWFSAPKATRLDKTINIERGGLDAFLTGLSGLDKTKPVSVKWSGFIEPLYEGTCTFYLSGADGLRLKIDNQSVIGDFSNTDPSWVVRPYLATNTEFLPLTGTFEVSTNQINAKLPIEVDFYSIGITEWSDLKERGIKLEWESSNQQREIIPQTQLYSDDILTGVNAVDVTSAISIYPNPASNQFVINSGQLLIEEIKIIDMQGRIIYQNNTPLIGSTTISVSDIAKGIYYLNLKGDSFLETKKIVVQ